MVAEEKALNLLEERLPVLKAPVTCKWLSRNADITFSESRRCLEKYKSNSDSVKSTYLLCGRKMSEKGRMLTKVLVIPESELEAVKCSFDELLSCQLYSLQMIPLKAFDTLYSLDLDVSTKFVEADVRHSGIELDASQVESEAPDENRVEKELSKEEKDSADKQEEPVETEKCENVPDVETTSTSVIVENDTDYNEKSASKEKEHGVGESTKKVIRKEKIKSAKKRSRVLDDTEAGENDLIEEKATKKRKNVQKPIADQTEPIRSNTDLFSTGADSSPESSPIKTRQSPRKPTPLSPQQDKSESGVQKKKSRKKTSNLSSQGQSAALDKFLSQSSSEPDKSDSQSLHSTQSSDVIAPTPPEKRGRPRKGKAVDKTFMDEEGFLVTKKVFEESSPNEELDGEAEKNSQTEPCKSSVRRSPRKHSAATASNSPRSSEKESKKKQIDKNRKQTSLTTFFKG